MRESEAKLRPWTENDAPGKRRVSKNGEFSVKWVVFTSEAALDPLSFFHSDVSAFLTLSLPPARTHSEISWDYP